MQYYEANTAIFGHAENPRRGHSHSGYTCLAENVRPVSSLIVEPSQPCAFPESTVSPEVRHECNCSHQDRYWIPVVRSFHHERYYSHCQRRGHMYFEYLQNCNRTEHRHDDTYKTSVENMAELKPDRGGKKTYQREQDGTRHPTSHFRMSEDLISHDDKRRKDQKEKAGDLGERR